MNPRQSDDTPSSSTPGARVSSGRKRTGLLLLGVVAVVLGVVVWQTWDYWHPQELETAGAADGPMAGAPGGGMPPGPPPGMFNPQEARRRLHERVKADMGATDQEWATLGPKVEAVTLLQEQLRQGRGMFVPPSPPPAPGGTDGPRSATRTATEDTADADATLRASVDDPQTPEAAVVANLKASRAARAKVNAELKAAQETLRSGLTLKQEAALVAAGILE
jgi:hypothetical protein